MKSIKIFDYVIIQIYKVMIDFYDNKRGVSFNTGGPASIISIFIGLNLVTLEHFLKSNFTIPLLDKTWPLLLVFIFIFFIINNYVYRVVTRPNIATLAMPKYTVQVVLTYIILTIGLFAY